MCDNLLWGGSRESLEEGELRNISVSEEITTIGGNSNGHKEACAGAWDCIMVILLILQADQFYCQPNLSDFLPCLLVKTMWQARWWIHIGHIQPHI